MAYDVAKEGEGASALFYEKFPPQWKEHHSISFQKDSILVDIGFVDRLVSQLQLAWSIKDGRHCCCTCLCCLG